MTRLSTLPDPEAAAAFAAVEIAHALRRAVEHRGVAHLALAGGNTPRRAYELLAGLRDDWGAVELWYGDERCVGAEDPESNHRLVAESLLAQIHGPAPAEHRIPGELGPEEAAAEYSALLRARVLTAGEWGPPALDLALLGIGEDGHTASLFPGHPEVEDSSGALCLPVRDAPKPPPERVTLSLPVLRAARGCLLLVTGAGKADALARVLAGPDPQVPASLLASEHLHVVADEAAAQDAASATES
ncbi:MAG TPA: 6-phosphogluconolactonase [Solirubrobacteraceae bacterium]|jgi:6-phosphogluconolactonase|nr:6-phosphogluconolactonase [Solirubrobacteraceae bacterium]